MNRGSFDLLGPKRGDAPASMRPRFMNRGSLGEDQPNRKPHAGFNEAPIHESGKSAGSRNVAETITRFNEAPIHESGK